MASDIQLFVYSFADVSRKDRAFKADLAVLVLESTKLAHKFLSESDSVMTSFPFWFE